MGKVTSMTLSDEAAAFVQTQLHQQRYPTGEAVVLAGLKRLAEDDHEIEQIRLALIEGEESGPAEDFDFDHFLAQRRPTIM